MFNWAVYVFHWRFLCFISRVSGTTRNIPPIRYVFVCFILCHFILIGWTIACDSAEDLDWSRFIFFPCQVIDIIAYARERFRSPIKMFPNMSWCFIRYSRYICRHNVEATYFFSCPEFRNESTSKSKIRIKKIESNFSTGIFLSYIIYVVLWNHTEFPAPLQELLKRPQLEIMNTFLCRRANVKRSDRMNVFRFWWYTQLCIMIFFF